MVGVVHDHEVKEVRFVLFVCEFHAFSSILFDFVVVADGRVLFPTTQKGRLDSFRNQAAPFVLSLLKLCFYMIFCLSWDEKMPCVKYTQGIF